MGKKGNRLTKCSTSTSVEVDVKKVTKPLHKAKKREFDDSYFKVIRKKQKIKKRVRFVKASQVYETLLIHFFVLLIQWLRNSVKELTETIKKLQESLNTKTNLPEISSSKSLKEKETLDSKTKVVDKYECCFNSEEAKGNNLKTIFVSGFNSKIAKDEIKGSLLNLFSSCGEVTRVFVPTECESLASIGYAFIDMKERR